MSLAGCTCGLTRVEMTQSESGPNSISMVDAIRRMREAKTMTNPDVKKLDC